MAIDWKNLQKETRQQIGRIDWGSISSQNLPSAPALSSEETLKLGLGPIDPRLAYMVRNTLLPTISKAPTSRQKVRGSFEFASSLQEAGRQQARDLVVSAARAIPRTLLSFGLPVVQPGRTEFRPTGKISQFLLGNEAVTPPQERIGKLAQQTSSFVGEKTPSLPSYLFGGIGIAGITVLDTFFGGGGAKSTAKAVAEEAIKQLAEKTGKEVAEEVALKVARDAVSALEGKNISKIELSPLAQEARKYKSAEEFAKTYRRGFHGTASDFKELGFGEGVRTNGMLGPKSVKSNAIFFSSDKDVADFFANNRAEYFSDTNRTATPRVIEKYLKISRPADFTTPAKADAVLKKSGISLDEAVHGLEETGSTVVGDVESGFLKLSELPMILDNPKYVEMLKKAGYDGAITIETAGGKTSKGYAVFDTKNLFTKSQLTDIWKSANATKGGSETKGIIERIVKNNIDDLKNSSEIGRGPTARRILGQETPARITKAETTLLKDRLRNLSRGAKIGASERAATIKGVQDELISRLSEIPVADRGKFITLVKNTQTEKQLESAIARIEPIIQQYEDLRILQKTLGSKRSKIAFIRKVGEFNQTAINDAKKSIGMTSPIASADEKMLTALSNELVQRLNFKEQLGFRTSLSKAESRELQITDEMYEANRAVREGTRTGIMERIGRFRQDVKQGLEKTMAPISTRLKNIDISLKRAIRRHEYNLKTGLQNRFNRSEGYVQKLARLSRDDFSDLDLALKNGDVETINRIIDANGMRAEYNEVRSVLNELHKGARDVGFDIGYLENYFPRVIKDPQGMLEYLKGTEEWGVIDEAIRRKELILGRVLNTEEKASLVNTMIRGYSGGHITLSGMGAVKERKIDIITPALNQFYADSNEALRIYISGMTDVIEARKFFGKSIKEVGEGALNVEDSIGTYVTDLLAKGKITPTQENELRNILTARFNEKGTRGLVGLYKNLAYINVMGSPYNAITQMGDLAFPIYSGGVWRTIKALPRAISGRLKMNRSDLGISEIAAEFGSNNKTSANAVQNVFRAVGLQKLDSIGKNTLIEATFNRYQKAAREILEQGATKDERFLRKIKEVFGDETDTVVRDLANGSVTEDTKYLIFNELLDVQPIALSEVPEKYLNSGNGRLFYALKTWTLKMFDVYRNEAFQLMRNPDTRVQGFKNLLRLTSALLIMNATADEAKDFMLGRKTSLKDRTIDNVLKLVGFSRYSTYQASREGLGSAIMSQVEFAQVPVINDLSKDILDIYKDWGSDVEVSKLRTWRNVPGVGKLYYWWFGKGTETKEREQKQNAPETALPSFNVGSSFKAESKPLFQAR